MESVRGHALLLPFPAQGHITPMMQLAKFLISKRLLVTFVNTDFTHQRWNPTSNEYITFHSFPDGLPPDHGRTLKVDELVQSLEREAPLHAEKIVKRIMESPHIPRLTFIVTDGMLSFTHKIADKFDVPSVAFWTTSACGFSAYYYLHLFIHHDYIRLKDGRESRKDETISCIPGMPTLRVKDLPNFLPVGDSSDYLFQYFIREAQNSHQASLVLLNTFEELEGPVLRDLNDKFSDKVFSIGPLLLYSEGDDLMGTTSNSIWKEETSCLEWLDKQQEWAVLYVCFGSITLLSAEELVEFAWGLEASGRPFLWGIRPDIVQGKSAVLPSEFVERTKDRSFFVSWAPQSKVLSHPSVGGFLTHSGWNSIIESISSGVPMICWPFFAEQPTNCRFVDDVWKIGFEIKDSVSRVEVERLVNKLMDLDSKDGKEMRARIRRLKDAALSSVEMGGASCDKILKFVNQMMGNPHSSKIEMESLVGSSHVYDLV